VCIVCFEKANNQPPAAAATAVGAAGDGAVTAASKEMLGVSADPMVSGDGGNNYQMHDNEE